MKLPLLIALAATAILFAADPGPAQVAPGQAPARDTAPPRTGTGRIHGRVVAADTGAPVRRATVRLAASEIRESRSVMTDADGKYDFRDLPPGTFMIMASRNGFLMTQLGQTGQNQPGKPVKLAGDQDLAAPDIALTRASAITGRVVDEFGDPVASSMVRLFRYQSRGGTRQMVPTGGASTNDLGQYRIFGLAAGTYYLAAQPQMGGDSIEVADHAGYAPTYYPGTPQLGQAQPLEVVAGRDITDVDLMLSVVRTVRVSGIVLDAHGKPAMNANLNAVLVEPGLAGGSFVGGAYARVQQDGAFTFNGLAPGDYLFTVNISQPFDASAPNGPRMQYGRVRMSVGNSDISGITLQAGLGTTVSGQLIFDGASAPPKGRLTVNASFTPLEMMAGPGMPSGPPAQVGADGTFVLTGVFGDRLFRVSGSTTGWILKAVYVNGRDMTDTPVPLEGREQLTGVQIVLTDRISHVNVTVEDDGQPAAMAYVIVMPDDASKSMPGSRYERSTVLRDGGPAKLDGLPAGDYFALALKGLTPGMDAYEQDVQERVRRTGVRFTLRDGETRDLVLKLSDLTAK